MAAVDLSNITNFPYSQTISNVGINQQEIILPLGKIYMSVGSNSTIYLADSNILDGAPMPAQKYIIPSNSILDLEYDGKTANPTLAVAAEVATADINVTLIK